MKLCDDAAVIAASRDAECRVVTLAVDGVLFRSPVAVGNVLILKATVNADCNSSMEVGVRVEAESPSSGVTCHTRTAYFTMVALDDEGGPKRVPRLEALAPEEVRRSREADLRRCVRLADPAELHGRTPEATPAVAPAPSFETDETRSMEDSSV